MTNPLSSETYIKVNVRGEVSSSARARYPEAKPAEKNPLVVDLVSESVSFSTDFSVGVAGATIVSVSVPDSSSLASMYPGASNPGIFVPALMYSSAVYFSMTRRRRRKSRATRASAK